MRAIFVSLLLSVVVAYNLTPAPKFTSLKRQFSCQFETKYSNSRKSYSRDISMNMFDRMFRVVTSNVNNVIKQLEDPEKVIEQAVIDMQSDLVKIRQSYAEITATQKKLEKQKEQAVIVAGDWYRRAQLALEKGDEELAREALSRRQTQLDTVENLNKQLSVQGAAVDKLYSSMGLLEQKIGEAKRQKETLIARARTAKTSVQVNDMLNNLSGSSSMEAFERMREKVDSLETQAEVAGELAATSSGTSVNLEERFRALEGDGKVEDELERMKRQLPPASGFKALGQLPSSRSLMDIEYEQMKRELRR